MLLDMIQTQVQNKCFFHYLAQAVIATMDMFFITWHRPSLLLYGHVFYYLAQAVIATIWTCFLLPCTGRHCYYMDMFFITLHRPSLLLYGHVFYYLAQAVIATMDMFLPEKSRAASSSKYCAPSGCGYCSDGYSTFTVLTICTDAIS